MSERTYSMDEMALKVGFAFEEKRRDIQEIRTEILELNLRNYGLTTSVSGDYPVIHPDYRCKGLVIPGVNEGKNTIETNEPFWSEKGKQYILDHVMPGVTTIRVGAILSSSSVSFRIANYLKDRIDEITSKLELTKETRSELDDCTTEMYHMLIGLIPTEVN